MCFCGDLIKIVKEFLEVSLYAKGKEGYLGIGGAVSTCFPANALIILVKIRDRSISLPAGLTI
jgi:hypothetical protein